MRNKCQSSLQKNPYHIAMIFSLASSLKPLHCDNMNPTPRIQLSVYDAMRGSHGSRKARGPKGLQLEVRDWRLESPYICRIPSNSSEDAIRVGWSKVHLIVLRKNVCCLKSHTCCWSSDVITNRWNSALQFVLYVWGCSLNGFLSSRNTWPVKF